MSLFLKICTNRNGNYDYTWACSCDTIANDGIELDWITKKLSYRKQISRERRGNGQMAHNCTRNNISIKMVCSVWNHLEGRFLSFTAVSGFHASDSGFLLRLIGAIEIGFVFVFVSASPLVMAALWNRAGLPLYFCPVVSSIFVFPCLISAVACRLDACRTWTHGVALVRI